MTPSEFKAWFDGFCEAMEGTPSVAQWTRIKARVAEIDGRAITEHVYINRYVPNYHPNYYWQSPYGWLYVYCGSGGAIGASNNLMPGGSGTSIGSGTFTVNGANTMAFDSHHAMAALGRAEAQEIN